MNMLGQWTTLFKWTNRAVIVPHILLESKQNKTKEENEKTKKTHKKSCTRDNSAAKLKCASSGGKRVVLY